MGEFSAVKFEGNRTYALLPSNGGTGPLRWVRTGTADATSQIHGNSLNNQNSTHVYAIRDDSGAVWKIGESAQGVKATGESIRADQQVRSLNRLYQDRAFESEIRAWFPDKASGRDYETRLIERYRAIFGQDKLPGNLTNR